MHSSSERLDGKEYSENSFFLFSSFLPLAYSYNDMVENIFILNLNGNRQRTFVVKTYMIFRQKKQNGEKKLRKSSTRSKLRQEEKSRLNFIVEVGLLIEPTFRTFPYIFLLIAFRYNHWRSATMLQITKKRLKKNFNELCNTTQREK